MFELREKLSSAKAYNSVKSKRRDTNLIYKHRQTLISVQNKLDFKVKVVEEVNQINKNSANKVQRTSLEIRICLAI